MKSERISPFWVGGYQPFSATVYYDSLFISEINLIKMKRLIFYYYLSHINLCVIK